MSRNTIRALAQSALSGLVAATLALPVAAQELQLEEVLVTAQKRQQTLQDVPVSVAVIGSDDLQKTVTNNFNDLAKITSGIALTGGQDGFGKIIRIRGVGTNAFVPSIRPAVGIFLNEIPLGAPEMAYNNLADIERVEILKGPQATLFGKEVSSGAISLFTRKPNVETADAYIETNAGNLGLVEVRGGGNVPLFGEAGLRFSGYYNERDGILDNAILPDDPGGEYEQSGFRAHLLYELTENLSLTLGYERHDTEIKGSSQITQEYGDLYTTLHRLCTTTASSSPHCYPDNIPQELVVRDPYDRVVDSSNPTQRDTDIQMWSAHLEWQINDQWSMTSITSDQEYEFLANGIREASRVATNRQTGQTSRTSIGQTTGATSVGPYYLDDFINMPSTDTFTQELRFNFDSGPWSSIIGAFYAETDTISFTPFTSPVGVLPGASGSITRVTAAGLSDITDDFEEWAIFTHNIYTIREGLDLTFGLRYSEVEKTAVKGQFTGGLFVDGVSPLPPGYYSSPTYLGTVGQIPTVSGSPDQQELDKLTIHPNATNDVNGALASLTENISGNQWNTWGNDIPEQNDTWDEYTGTLKLTYWLNDDVSFYGGWSRGFKAGGHNVCKNRPTTIDDRGSTALSLAALDRRLARLATLDDVINHEPVCPPSFDAEIADNFEVGMKGRFLDRSLNWNLSAFYQTYDDYQVDIADEIGIGNSIQNAAQVKIQGIETDIIWLASQNLTLTANASYIDATWDKYDNAGCLRPQYQREACSQQTINGVLQFMANGLPVMVQDLAGEQLNHSPEWSGFVSATWADEFAGWQWYVRGEWSYQDDQNFFPDGDPDLMADDYQLFNASLGITSPNSDWNLTLWGKNIGDEEYLETASRNRDNTQPTINPTTNSEGYRVTPGPERTYGLTVRYSFE